MAVLNEVLDSTEAPDQQAAYLAYVEALSLIERLHRLMLDMIKDEFERLGLSELTSVQALLIFNIGQEELSAGELKSRGYYQGSNVSYNLKKLVELGYIESKRSSVDRRAVRIRLTEKGREISDLVRGLCARQAQTLLLDHEGGADNFERLNETMRGLERFWRDQIRFIY